MKSHILFHICLISFIPLSLSLAQYYHIFLVDVEFHTLKQTGGSSSSEIGKNLPQTATSTYFHLLIWFLCLAGGFWPLYPLSLQRRAIYKMWHVLFGRCLNVMGFFPSLSAEIRGFKVQSYTPEKELPDCSQVIVGKESCVPRLGHAKLLCSYRAPGSRGVHII